MRLLITDVTEMGGGNFCVAGWNAASASMVRPLPNGVNWSSSLIGANGIAPGITIEVVPNGAAPNGTFPHRTEDTPIIPASIQVVALPAPNWLGATAPMRANTVQDAFGNNVVANNVWNGRQQGVHVPENTVSRSLWGLEISRHSMSFTTDFGKLKAVVDDGDEEYLISVSARYLKEAFRTGGEQAVNDLLPANGQLHVRLGLARSWSGQPEKCYLMINGVYW